MNFEERPEVVEAYYSQFEEDHLLRLADDFNSHIDGLVGCGVYTEEQGEEYKRVHHIALWAGREALDEN